MLISDLTELAACPEVAVIINVDTKYVSTLALLSTLRYARMPVVMIDCESRDGSFAWFERLMADQEFYLMSARLRQHGETITRTFYGRMFADHPELNNVFNAANNAASPMMMPIHRPILLMMFDMAFC